ANTANYYVIRATSQGSSLTYINDSTSELNWNVPGGLFGKLSHVALTFDHGTNITAYVNGQNLGTKHQTSFGTGAGAPAWIGSVGTSSSSSFWLGSVDELAIYSTPLSQTTIQVHYSDFFFGTNTSAPTIVSLPPSRTLLSGSSPILNVQASGTLPLTYQW